MAISVYSRPSDIITSEATITVGSGITPIVSTDVGYGLSALYDRNPAKPLKFQTTGAIRLVADFGSPRRIEGMAIPHHNFDPGCIVAFQLNTADSWGAPAVSVPLTMPELHLDGHRCSPWVDFTTASGYGTGSYRYASISVGANVSPTKVGEWLIMSALRTFQTDGPSHGFMQFGARKGTQRRFIESLETEYGVVRVARRKIKQRLWSFRMLGASGDSVALQQLGDDCGGRALPFFFAESRGSAVDEGLYVRFTREAAQRLQSEEQWFNLDNFALDIEEVSRSLPL